MGEKHLGSLKHSDFRSIKQVDSLPVRDTDQPRTRYPNWLRILFVLNFADFCSGINLSIFIELETHLGPQYTFERLKILLSSIISGSVAGLLVAILADSLFSKYYIALWRCMSLFGIGIACLYGEGSYTLLSYCYFLIFFTLTYTFSTVAVFMMEYNGDPHDLSRAHVNAVLLTMSLFAPFSINLYLIGVPKDNLIYIALTELIISFCAFVIIDTLVGKHTRKDILIFKIIAFMLSRKEKRIKPSTRTIESARAFLDVILTLLPFTLMWIWYMYLKSIWLKQVQYYDLDFSSYGRNWLISVLNFLLLPIVGFIIQPIFQWCNILKTYLQCISVGYFLVGASILTTAVVFAPVEGSLNTPSDTKYANIMYFNLKETPISLSSSLTGTVEILPKTFLSVKPCIKGLIEDEVKVGKETKIIYAQESSRVIYCVSNEGLFKPLGFKPVFHECRNYESTLFVVNTVMDKKGSLFLYSDSINKSFPLSKATTDSFIFNKSVLGIILKTKQETIHDHLQVRSCTVYALFIHGNGHPIMTKVTVGETKTLNALAMIPQLVFWALGSALVYPNIFALAYTQSPAYTRTTGFQFVVFDAGIGAFFASVTLYLTSSHIFRVDIILYAAFFHYFIFLLFLNFINRPPPSIKK